MRYGRTVLRIALCAFVESCRQETHYLTRKPVEKYQAPEAEASGRRPRIRETSWSSHISPKARSAAAVWVCMPCYAGLLKVFW